MTKNQTIETEKLLNFCNLDWDDKCFEQIAHRVAIVTNESIDLPENANVAVLLCDDAKIKSLNKKFRGNPHPTNILSFRSLSFRI